MVSKAVKRLLLASLFFLFLFLILVIVMLRSDWRKDESDIRKWFTKGNYYELKFADTQVGKIRYLKCGNKSAENLLMFIHGAPGSLDAFQIYLLDEELQSEYTLISVDRPGYGYSDYGKSEVSIMKQAEVLNELLIDENYENVHIVSHSYGCAIGAVLSNINKNVKSHLMTAPVLNPKDEQMFFFSEWPRSPFFGWMFSPSFKVSCEEKMSHADELKRVEDQFRDVLTPTYLVHGKDDNIAPMSNVHYAKRIFNKDALTIEVLEDTGHLIPFKKMNFLKSRIDSLVNNLKIR